VLVLCVRLRFPPLLVKNDEVPLVGLGVSQFEISCITSEREKILTPLP